MDNAIKRQWKRVNEPAFAPAAPGRDVLLALATAWSSSHGSPHAGAVPAVVPSPAAPRTFGVAGRPAAAAAGRTRR